MPAYWVARGKVHDPVEYKKYADQVPAILAKYGGKALARGGRFQIMEGPETFQRLVVIEFPTFERASPVSRRTNTRRPRRFAETAPAKSKSS